MFDGKCSELSHVHHGNISVQMKPLTRKAPNTTIAEFANTVDPDETAHNEPSHLDLQCLPSSLSFFKIVQFTLKVFLNFADAILSSAFFALYGLK